MAPKRVNLKRFLEQSSPKNLVLDFQIERIVTDKFVQNMMYLHETKYSYVHVCHAGPAFLYFAQVGRKVLLEWSEAKTYLRFAVTFTSDRSKQLVYCVLEDHLLSCIFFLVIETVNTVCFPVLGIDHCALMRLLIV